MLLYLFLPKSRAMRKINRIIAILGLSAFAITAAYAQCIPDTANCIDTGDPGQICPSDLPEVIVNVPYDEVITVIAPDSAFLSDLAVGLHHIAVDSIKNLPPGINYYINATEFYPDSAYCIQISGTPTQEGEYHLEIYVSAFVEVLQTVYSVGQIVDDTSVVMTVHGTSGINPIPVNEFHVLPGVPNPFTDFTTLGFYTPFDDRIELQVFNILGKLMHEEIVGAPAGEHLFQFDGNALLPGTYFYRVTNSSKLHTGKFIKSR